MRRGELLDCFLGINHFGVSERVVEAAKEYDWSRVWYYPDPIYKELKEKISEFWSGYADLETDQIQIANGAAGVLERLNKIFIELGSWVLGYSPQFPDYVTWLEAYGGKYEAIVLNPEENFKFHVERLLARIDNKYCLIYIDNPNTPTGQIISLDEVEEILLQAERKDAVVVVDEAFGEYMGKENSAVNLIDKYSNLIVVRSFSKGFGLAGLRVGYGIFPPELSKYYDKVDLPLSVSAVSCYLAGEALLDTDFIPGCRRIVETEKRRLIKGLREKGYLISETSESCPIFALGHKNTDIDLKEELLARGILTISGTAFRNLTNNYVRVNIPANADDFLGRL